MALTDWWAEALRKPHPGTARADSGFKTPAAAYQAEKQAIAEARAKRMAERRERKRLRKEARGKSASL